MGNRRLILFIFGVLFFLSNLAAVPSADDILLNVINRLAGIDRSMLISSDIYKKGKLNDHQVMKLSVYWPDNGKIEKMTNIIYEKPRKRAGVQFWEHVPLLENKPLRWITLPVTGKLKDITGKNHKKSGFDISELQLNKKDIEDHSNKLIDQKKLNGYDVYIIESKKNKNNNRGFTKILTIDKEHHFIWEVETKNKKGKLVKSIKCSDLQLINGIPVLTSIEVMMKKGKKKIKVKLSKIKFYPDFDLRIFQPLGKT